MCVAVGVEMSVGAAVGVGVAVAVGVGVAVGKEGVGVEVATGIAVAIDWSVGVGVAGVGASALQEARSTITRISAAIAARAARRRFVKMLFNYVRIACARQIGP